MQQKKTKLIKKINLKLKLNYGIINPISYNFVLKKRETPHKRIYLALAGSCIGFLNGFFGGGGGMICVPILQKVCHLNQKQAHATAILVIFPLSLISACIYVFNGFISSYPLLTVGVGVVAGGILGSFALKFLPPKWIKIIFVLIMLAGGVRLII